MADNQNITTHRFRFEGNGAEYFKIWIVNLLLGIVTLGIYFAWAKVRTNRYFYGNTYLDGSSFEYHAKPLQILKGRLIAITALIVYLVAENLFPLVGAGLLVIGLLAFPWVIWSSLRFNARMSSYRNVRFSFNGKLSDAYLYLLFVPFLPALMVIPLIAVGDPQSPLFGIGIALAMTIFYLLVPYVQALFQGYYVNSSRYGQGVFRANIRTSFYYLTYLKVVVFGILGLILVGAVMMAFMYTQIDVTQLQAGAEEFNPQLLLLIMGPSLIIVMLLYMVVAVWIKSYMQAAFRNYLYARSRLDKVASFESQVTANGLFKVQIVNLLLLILTLGLAYPWTQVRLAKYSADTLDVMIRGDLQHYVQQQENAQSAIAEELGEAFDVAADLGVTL
jgi:uncharacterized membrane protein YjgN (DUF898 family)